MSGRTSTVRSRNLGKIQYDNWVEFSRALQEFLRIRDIGEMKRLLAGMPGATEADAIRKKALMLRILIWENSLSDLLERIERCSRDEEAEWYDIQDWESL